MILPVRQQSGVLIAAVSGRIDHVGSETFARAVDSLLADANYAKIPLLLDFSGVDYVSSAGLRILMMASRRAKADGRVFAIAELQPLVFELFTISRFTLIMPCYNSTEAALQALAT